MTADKEQSQRIDSSNRAAEAKAAEIIERPLSNAEIINLRYELMAYIERMQEAFDKASYLFADLEKRHQQYLGNKKTQDGQEEPEYGYISTIKYMESELIYCFLTIGAAVSEIGATTKAILQTADVDMAVIEPHRLGEAFLTELYAMGRESEAINTFERKEAIRKINLLLRLLDTQPQLKKLVRLTSNQRSDQDFLEDTWKLMRLLRNSISHLKPLPSMFALWAIGKHYFPELHSTNLAILMDDNRKAELWNDELDDDAPFVGHEDADKGVIVNYLADFLPGTIVRLKQEALSQNRAGNIRTGGKEAFRGRK